jgi:uncharacterized repeat protein (TIGR03803 family)
MGVVDGLGPIARLFEGSDGLLYGTTPDGGTIFSGPGLVFRIDKEGKNYQVLYRFQGGSSSYYTRGGVTECSDGKLYGTTFGDASGQSVFRLNKDGSDFEAVQPLGESPLPVGELIEAPDGTLRGIFSGMGMDAGHVFRVNKDGTELTTIHSFGLSLDDGMTPTGDLSLGADGTLYGTTSGGGSKGFGTVFRMELDGTGYAVLHSFDSSSTNGWAPMASLLDGRDGFLYGSTSPDTNGSGGTLFKLQRDGSTYTLLHSFPVGNGSGPRGTLIQGRDGALYGTTYQVIPNGVPVAFQINPDGTGYRELLSLAGERRPHRRIKGPKPQMDTDRHRFLRLRTKPLRLERIQVRQSFICVHLWLSSFPLKTTRLGCGSAALCKSVSSVGKPRLQRLQSFSASQA